MVMNGGLGIYIQGWLWSQYLPWFLFLFYPWRKSIGWRIKSHLKINTNNSLQSGKLLLNAISDYLRLWTFPRNKQFLSYLMASIVDDTTNYDHADDVNASLSCNASCFLFTLGKKPFRFTNFSNFLLRYIRWLIP